MTQGDKSFQTWLRYIRRQEKVEGWPHFEEAELKQRYDELCARAAAREVQIRGRVKFLLVQEVAEASPPKGWGKTKPIQVIMRPVLQGTRQPPTSRPRQTIPVSPGDYSGPIPLP